ncbi:MAG: ComEA family DNA-binding protein [Pseudomonadota bacterium]
MARFRTCSRPCALLAATLVSALAWGQTIDINTAGASELQSLPGIGPKLAEEIVSDRDRNGPFESVEELTRVQGISAGTVAKLRGQITLGKDQALVVRPGSTVTSSQVRAALKPYAGEPSIREVQDSAVAYARAHPDRIDGWRARAANRAFAPQFEAALVKDWDSTERVFEEVGQPDRFAKYKYDNWQMRLRARWDLDRAVFDPEEPKVNREALRLQRYRDDVLDEVTRRYFERRRLQIEVDLAPPTEMADRVRKELRLQELTADIDALTGGEFSSRLKSIGRDPY